MAGDIEVIITRYQKATQSHSTGSEIVLRNDELIYGLTETTRAFGSSLNRSNPLNELQEVFSSISLKEENSSNDVDNLLLSTDVLLPLPVPTAPERECGNKIAATRDESQKKSRFSDLDKLSEDLLKEQLDAINEKKTLDLTKL